MVGPVAPLHGRALDRLSMDFAHVSTGYGRHVTIVPRNRDRVPPRFGNDAAVSGVASPINPVTLLEAFGFVDGHVSLPPRFGRECIMTRKRLV